MLSRLKNVGLLLFASLIGLMPIGDVCGQTRDVVADLADARRIYVPAEDLDVLFERFPRGTLLPKAKFEELLQLAKANAEKASAPKVPLVLTASDYEARVAGDQMLLSVTAKFTQFAAGWQSLAIPMQRVGVEKVTLDDEPALLGRNADGSISLLSDKRGTRTLKLELSTELNSLGSDQVAAFSLLGAPSGSLSLTLPAGKRLLLGSLQLERPAPLEQAADYKVSLGGAAGLQLRITDRAAENAADALTFATTGYGLHVAPGEVTWHALTTLQVFGKPVDRLTFSVPSTLEIAGVDATGLEAWSLSDEKPAEGDGPARTVISLTFGQAFDGVRKVSIKGVMAIETGTPWSVPPLEIRNVTSHIGQVQVQHPAGVRLRIEETSGVRRSLHQQKPTADMPDEMSKLNATEYLRFDVWQPNFLLRLTTQPKEREVQAGVAAVLDVNATGLDIQAAFTVETRFAPLFELDVMLQAEWKVLSAQRGGAPLPFQISSDAAGVNRLRIKLDPPIASEQSQVIQVSLHRDVEGWPVEADPILLALPELHVPQSSISEGILVIRGDDDLDLSASELKGLDTVPLKADYERMRFQSQDSRYSGQLKVARKPSRLSVQSVTIGRLDPQTMHTFLQSVIDVQGGGVRVLKLMLPEAAGTALRFQCTGAQVVEQKPATPTNGERLWTLQLDRRVRGQIILFCDIEVSRGQAKQFSVPVVRFVDAERQNGFLVAEAGGDQRLAIEAKSAEGAVLTEVDPLDLPAVLYQPKERMVAFYRHVSPGATFVLSEERFDKLPVPTAVCPKLELTSVLGRTGEFHHKAVFDLMAVGVQGLRLTLPADVTLWSTLVNGEPVEVRRQGDQYLIPLTPGYIAMMACASATEAGHGPMTNLTLFYRSAVAPLTKFGTLEQAPPELAVQSGQGDTQPVEVLDQHWTVHYPRETRLVGSDGVLEPQQELDDTSVLNQFNSGWKVPTLAELGRQLLTVLIALGAISLLVMLYRRRGSINIGFTTGAAIAVVIVFIAGFWLMSSQERSNAGKYSESAADGYGDYSRPTVKSAAPLPTAQPPMVKDAEAWEEGDKQPGQPPAKGPDVNKPGVRFEAVETDGMVRNLENEALFSDQVQQSLEMPNRRPARADGEQPADEWAANADRSKKLQALPNEPMDQKGEAKKDGGKWPDVAAGQEGQEGRFGGQGRRSSLGGPQKQLGLLSLAMELQKPEGSLEKSFRYIGSDASHTAVALQLDYVDEASGKTMRLFLMALVALIGWFYRRASCRTKITLAAVGLTIPLALLPLVPREWQVVLDGLFFGAVAACLLWLVRGLCECLCKCCSGCCGWTWSSTGTVAGTCSTPGGTVAGLVLVGLLLAGQPVQAQPAQPQPAQKPQAQPAANGPAANASPAGKPSNSVAVEPNTVIVPYDIGTDPLASDKVFLRLSQFTELYKQAHPDSAPIGTAPQAGGVVEAYYAAKVTPNDKQPDESLAEITARFVVRSQVDGQFLVELPFVAGALRSAKVNGGTAALIVKDGCAQVAITKPGLHVVDVVFPVVARLSGSTGSFALNLKAVPTGKLSFALPDKKLNVRINGSTTIYRRVTQGETTSVELPVDKGGEISIAWQPEQAQGAATAVVHVDSVQSVTLTDGGTNVSTGFQYRIRQGSVADVSFTLPTALRLQAVNGPDVGGWELQGEGDARKLRVIFRRNVSDTTRLTVETFLDARVGDEPTVIDVPPVAPQEITNEIGQVVVFAGNQFTLRAEKAEGLNQIDGDKFTTTVPVSRPNVVPQLAYRFAKRPFQLSLRAARLASQTHVVAQQAASVSRRKLQLSTRLIYSLTGAPRSSVNVLLPQDYVVLDVKATGLHDWSLTKNGDAASLTIDLNAPRLGRIDVVVNGTIARSEAATSADLVFPRPIEPTKLETTAAIWLDESYSGTVELFDGWRSVDASQVPAELRAVKPQRPVQFAFQSSNLTPGPISVKLNRAEAKLSGNVLTMVTVSDVSVIQTLALQWKIEAGATDTLVFTTPKTLAGKLEFTGEGIRETSHNDIEGDRTRWTIRLRSPISGKYFATAVGALPPASKEIEAPAVVLEQSTGSGPGANGNGANNAEMIAPVAGQQSFVLLINWSQSQLTTLDPARVESVQREDVPVVVTKELFDQATELVRVKQTLVPPKWSMQSFVQTQNAPATIYLADLLTIVARDGTYRGQAVYTIKNRSRQFLALKFPAETELLSVFVGDQPSRAVTTKRQNESIQLIALPKTSAASLSFPVKVVWRGRLTGALPKQARMLRQEFGIPAPEVVGQLADPEYGMPVSRTQWTVRLPEGLDVVPAKSVSKHNLTLQPENRREEAYQYAWIQDLNELVSYSESLSSRNEPIMGGTQEVQNSLALNNAKKLEGMINRYSYGNAELAEQRSKANQRLAEVQSKFVKEQSGRQRIQAVPQTSTPGLVIGGGTFLEQNWFKNDVDQTILGNRDNVQNLIFNNGGVGTVLSGVDPKAESSFEFGVVLSDESTVVSTTEAASKPGESSKSAEPNSPMAGKPSSAKGSGVASRKAQQEANYSNLQDLNKSINDNRSGNNPAANAQNDFQSQVGQQQGWGGAVNQGTVLRGNSIVTNSGSGLSFGTNILDGFNSNNPVNPYGLPMVTGGSMANGTVLTGPIITNNSGLQFRPGPMVDGPGPGFIPMPQGGGRDFDSNGDGIADFIVDGGGAIRAVNPNVPAFGWVNQPQGMWRFHGNAMAGEAGGGMGGGGGGRGEGGQAIAPPVWTRAGGLSLPFDLPDNGQTFVFTKVGGDPKLTLAVRPQASMKMGLNLAWSAVWAGLGVFVALAARSGSSRARQFQRIPLGVAIVSLIGFLTLPGSVKSICFVLFVLSAMAIAWNNREGKAAA